MHRTPRRPLGGGCASAALGAAPAASRPLLGGCGSLCLPGAAGEFSREGMGWIPAGLRSPVLSRERCGARGPAARPGAALRCRELGERGVGAAVPPVGKSRFACAELRKVNGNRLGDVVTSQRKSRDSSHKLFLRICQIFGTSPSVNWKSMWFGAVI